MWFGMCFCVFFPQDLVLMRALRDMNLPKFVAEDVPLFLGLIADLFPGLDCPRVRYPTFNEAVEDILQEDKYILLPDQVLGLIIRSFYTTVDSLSAISYLHSLYAVCGLRLIRWCSCMRQ